MTNEQRSLSSSATIVLLFPPSLYLNYTPPLNLAYIAAVLDQAGHRVSIIDASSLHGARKTEDILEELKALKPHLIGMTLNVMFIQPAYELVKLLKQELPSTIIAAGGPHPSLLADEALDMGFDVVVRGEGERTTVELVRALSGEGQLAGIAGLSYKHQGQNVHNPNRQLIDDLDGLPFPAKHLFTRTEYVEDSEYYQAYGPIFSGRGCPARCTYCYKGVFGATVRVRSAENVYQEMLHLHQTYGTTAFEFMDDSFSVYPERVFRLCELLLLGEHNFKWQCTTRLDFTSPALLQKMKQAGCFRVFYGFESGDKTTLKRIKKRLDVEQAVTVLKWTKQQGIRSIVGFMYGFPWETVDQVHNTTKIIKRLRPYVDEFNPLGIMIPVPGTEIYQEYALQYGLEGWWLKTRFGHRYRSNSYYPYFRKRFYNDFALLEDGFFPFPSAIRRAIISGTRVIGTHNVFSTVSFPKNLFIYLFVHISMGLYQLSPNLEQAVFTRLARGKDILKKVWFALRRRS